MSVLVRASERDAFAELSRFRTAFYGCLSARADAFFELTDALLCADGPARRPVELSLLAERQRGYGSLCGALNHGRLGTTALRDLLISLPLPRYGERIVLTVDVSPWLRADAACSPERLFGHVHGRSKASAQIIPGWPYSFVSALTPDRTSWTAVLDVVRLGPEDDAIAVTAHQLRQVVERLIRAGQWQHGDRDVLVVMDVGHDVMCLAWLLSDLPVEVVGRLRSDRVLRLPKPPRVYDPKGGRPPQARTGVPPGQARDLARARRGDHERHATLRQGRGTRMGSGPPPAHHRSAWIDLDGELPLIEGTLIRLKVDHLARDRGAPPVWLWSSATGATPDDVDFVWSCYLRRFDLEHAFRLFKQSWAGPAPDCATRRRRSR